MSDRNRLEAAIRETGGTVEANGNIRGGNLSKVADKLGVARKTLYNHMKALGLRGASGRPKKRFKKRARTYAAAAAVGTAVLAVGVGVAMASKKPSTLT